MESFVITHFNSLICVKDPEGRKKQFFDRKYAGFIIPLKGKIRFSYEGGEVIAEAGRPVFLPRGLSYLNECLETAESYVLNFQTAASYPVPIPLSPISEGEARGLYERIHAKSFSGSLENTLAIFSDLYALAHRLLQGCSDVSQVHPALKRAMDFMRQYCHSASLTVGDVARHCYVSEVYLRKLFERELHTSPFRRLTELRMEKAKLLIEEKRPLKEVAAGVGYSDVFQFSRAYKRHFGHPPSKENGIK